MEITTKCDPNDYKVDGVLIERIKPPFASADICSEATLSLINFKSKEEISEIEIEKIKAEMIEYYQLIRNKTVIRVTKKKNKFVSILK